LLVVELVIFDPPEAALKRKPYEVRLATKDASVEQCLSGVLLLGALTERVQKYTRDRYPGALEAYMRGDPLQHYGTGQVTGVEDDKGQQVPPFDQEKDEDKEPEHDRG
jgi:hypothetical protein